MPKRKKEVSEHTDRDGDTPRGKKKAKAESEAAGGQPSSKGQPFPNHSRPTEAECRAARDSLALLHGEPSQPSFKGRTGSEPILDSLISTILSQNTTDTNSHRAFLKLQKTFGSWEAVRTAAHEAVVEAIKSGGLAETKTTRIQAILNSVKSEQGRCSLEHLSEKPDAEIKSTLLQYPGVGPKTVACVLMFCLGRQEFPVDTHVWRITKSLGWVPEKANREQTYEHLNEHVPADIKYALHVLLVEHGKTCPRCAKNNRPRRESLGPCPLAKLATAATAGKKLSASTAAKSARRELESLEEVSDEVKVEESEAGWSDDDIEIVDGEDAKVPAATKEEPAEAAVKKEEPTESVVKKEEPTESVVKKEEPDEKPANIAVKQEFIDVE